MNRSPIWSWLFGHGKKSSARRVPSKVQLAVETLEDRLVPSGLTLAQWRQQTFQIDDVKVANVQDTVTAQSTQPSNASFGSMIGLPSVFANTPYRGQGYSVAVIDTGIDYLDPSLGGGFGPGYKVIAGYNFVNNTADPMDDNGHGTVVAGEIASSDATYSGVAPDVNLIALKVLDSTGSGTFGNVQNALDWVVANQAKYNIVAINMSLGSGNYTSNPYTFLDGEFTTLKNDGVFISVAAGNSFYTNNSAVGLDYPAVDPNVVSVGAVYDGNYGSVAWASGARDYTTGVDHIASFSQRGPALSIMAPGAMVTSTYLNDTFQQMAGTSMAAPVVTGAAVLIHQELDALHKTANQSTILSIMQSTGVTLVDGKLESTNVTATGLTFKRLDLGAALASLGTPPGTGPVMQAIPKQAVAPGGSVQITLSATDPDGAAITFSAILLNATSNQAYQLKQQLGLQCAGSYYTNQWGQNEKWMTSSGGSWYCILPDGELRLWTGSMTSTLQAANLIATLNPSFYADPSLLWNAQPSGSAAATVSVVGNQLTVQAAAGVAGSYQIQVVASDGKASSAQTFTLTIESPPQLAAIPSQSLLTNRSQTITLSATDAVGNPITYSAKLVGTFTTTPACLVIVGNQLTIYTSPDFVGTYDVQVTASDGSMSSSTTMHVTVAASAVADRFFADFTGNGIKDTAFFNQDGSWWVSINKPDGSFVNQKWASWAPASNWSLIQVGNFVGDGKTDIVGFYNDGSWWVGKSTGANFVAQFWAQWDAPKYWGCVQVGNFTGDGRTDIIGFAANGTWWVGASTGASFASSVWATWDPSKYWTYVSVGDFNGDGKLDIIGINIYGSIWVGTSTGASFKSALWSQWSAASNWSSFSTADANGDGMLDFLGLNTNGKWYVGYSTGSAFNTQAWTGPTPPSAK